MKQPKKSKKDTTKLKSRGLWSPDSNSAPKGKAKGGKGKLKNLSSKPGINFKGVGRNKKK